MKLFRLLRNKASLPAGRQGFTLIELLIVIALLGALAVGLIGALDPFEQLKKGTDTGTRDLVNQVQTAVIRYFSIKNNMPWCDDLGACTDPASGNLLNAAVDAGLDRMIAAGELKIDFKTIQKGKLDEVFVTSSSVVNTVAACYLPTSKSFKADPNTKFEVSGVLHVPDTECEGHTAGATYDCYWCIQ